MKYQVNQTQLGLQGFLRRCSTALRQIYSSQLRLQRTSTATPFQLLTHNCGWTQLGGGRGVGPWLLTRCGGYRGVQTLFIPPVPWAPPTTTPGPNQRQQHTHQNQAEQNASEAGPEAEEDITSKRQQHHTTAALPTASEAQDQVE